MNVLLTAVCIGTLSLFMATVLRGIGLSTILNPEALIIVCGGTVAAVFMGFPAARIRTTLGDIAASFSQQRDRSALVGEIVDLARLYRKSDIRAFEGRMARIRDEYLRLGAGLLINGKDRDGIRNILERELSLRIMQLNFSQNLLKTVARLTPSFGLAGTVISLIRMFRDTQSIEAVAPMMSVAMMSTFYGVILSSLFMLPLCAKLRDYALHSEALMHIVIEGMDAVYDREHPLQVEERLSGCPAPSDDHAAVPPQFAVAKSERGA